MGVQSAFEMLDVGIGKLKDLSKDAAALDDVYADVMKTTGLTHEQVENLNKDSPCCIGAPTPTEKRLSGL